MPKHVSKDQPVLSPADQSAIDAWLEGPIDQRSDRAGRVGDLLSLLDAGVEDVSEHRDDLVLVTMARVLRDRDQRSVGVLHAAERSPMGAADAAAIDALAGVPADAEPARAERLLSLLSPLDVPDTDLAAGRDQLVGATLDRIQRDIDQRRHTMRLSPAEMAPAPRRGLRLSDIGAIAAVFLIGLGLILPVVHGLQAEKHRIAGQQNLMQAGLGFGLFASDHDDRMPSQPDWTANNGWWHVGEPGRSHSANLFRLVTDGYVSLGDLAFPGNALAPTRVTDPSATDWASPDELSYSYQLFGDRTPRLSGNESPWTVVLTDRSPVIERARRDRSIDVAANSRNHQGRGQNVLFADGRVSFHTTPVLPNGDHLFLPRTMENAIRVRIGGDELPAGRDDAFVGP